VFCRELAVVSPVQSPSCSARKASLPHRDTALHANWTKTRGYTAPAVHQQAPADMFWPCPGNANMRNAARVEANAGLAHASAASVQALKPSAHIKATKPLQQQSQAKKHKSMGSNILDSQLSHTAQRAAGSAPADVVQGSSTRSIAPTSVFLRENVPQLTDKRHITSHLSSSECKAAPGKIVTATEDNETFQTRTKKKRPRRKLVQKVLPAAPGSSMLPANDLKHQCSGVQWDREDAAGSGVDPGKSAIPKTKTGNGSNKVCQFSWCLKLQLSGSKCIQCQQSSCMVMHGQYSLVCTAPSALSM